jgi:hypothetical protein
MTRIALALALLVGAGLTARADEPAAKEGDGWRPLYNGKDLDGWKHVGPGGMAVQPDGTIRTEGGMGLLWYTKEALGDCQLKVVYKTTAKASNAGVFIRIDGPPEDEWYAVHHGYEVQICDSADAFHRTGAVYSLSKATAQPGKVGEWNTLLITLKGERIDVSVNDIPVNSFDPTTAEVPPRTKSFEPERGPRPTKGYIGLQNHDDYAKGTEVYFRSVEVRPLAR